MLLICFCPRQENNVPCEICGKLVKNKNILKQHVKLVHEKKQGAVMITYSTYEQHSISRKLKNFGFC